MINRRTFLLGLGAAAPALIAAGNLMKVKALEASILNPPKPPAHGLVYGTTHNDDDQLIPLWTRQEIADYLKSGRGQLVVYDMDVLFTPTSELK